MLIMIKQFKNFFSFFFIFILSLYVYGCNGGGASSSGSSAKAITAYSIAGPNGVVKATFSGSTISATMPYGTNLTNLVATFTTTGSSVAVNNTTQHSGVTPNNFTNPVIYTVTASDGSTNNYTVKITDASIDAKWINTFSLETSNGLVPASITGNNINATVPAGTDLTRLIAQFTYIGSNVKVGSAIQQSGITSNDFTNPITYTVTAADGTSLNYVVTVKVAGQNANSITYFALTSQQIPHETATGVITGNNISVTMPYGTTDLTKLVATYVTDGSKVTVNGQLQTDSQSVNNFTYPLTYTVTAANGATNTYVVTATIAKSNEKSLNSYAIGKNNGVFNGQNITVYLPENTTNTQLQNLIATFSYKGVSVTVNNIPQTSGTTANNFNNPTKSVIYTVAAADGSTTNYTVTVQLQDFTCVADGANGCGCIIENNGSGLEWYASSLTNSGAGYTFNNLPPIIGQFNAQTHCGQSDWRIPSLTGVNGQSADPTSDFGSLIDYVEALGFDPNQQDLGAWLNQKGFNIDNNCGSTQCIYWSSNINAGVEMSGFSQSGGGVFINPGSNSFVIPVCNVTN